MTANDVNSTGERPNRTPPGPGMIMGPDGKLCKVCTAFRNWRPRTEANEKKPSAGHKSTSTTMAALAFGSASTSSQPEVPPPHCPPDVEQLGRATWTFLHTTAAYYPEHPTPIQRANILSLIRSLPMVYPCTSCATDFGEDMEAHPPDVSGRVGLSRWLCERHNQVNEKLGKEKFDCSKTDERWKDGPSDGSCD